MRVGSLACRIEHLMDTQNNSIAICIISRSGEAFVHQQLFYKYHNLPCNKKQHKMSKNNRKIKVEYSAC